MDNLDKEYLKKLAEKTIKESDGKVPIKQISDEDYDGWDGVNVQGYSQLPPAEAEQTLAIYLIDAKDQLSKRFTVTAAMLKLFRRETQRIVYGTTNPLNQRQVKVIVQWEREVRV